jgi:hypothetical protein
MFIVGGTKAEFHAFHYWRKRQRIKIVGCDGVNATFGCSKRVTKLRLLSTTITKPTCSKH